MGKGRLEAFSDGVLAIIITIMVLELKVPHGAELESLRPVWPHLATYLISFVYVGIYWNNHHHLLHAVKRVNPAIMWGNMHLLFWLSLTPVTTAWNGEHLGAAVPAAAYGAIFFMAAIAYQLLQIAIARHHPEVKTAVGRDFKGKVSFLSYAAAIGLAFVSAWFSIAIYVAIAILWFVPDRRLAHVAENHQAS